MKILTGPCVLEDRDTVMRIAEKLKPLSEDKRVDFYFKASFAFRSIFPCEAMLLICEI